MIDTLPDVNLKFHRTKIKMVNQGGIYETFNYNDEIMETNTVYKIGNYIFDYNNNILVSSKEKRKLTRKETDLLQLLADNPNTIIKRDFALKKIWGRNDYFMGRSMDVYISKLRKLLMDDSNVSIVNIHNTGFMLTIKD